MSGYDDIINLSRPESKKHKKMTLYDRAAQFAPFAALTGYDSVIRESARVTDKKYEPDEYEKAELDLKLQQLIINLSEMPPVSVTYFVADKHKEGGKYITLTDYVKKIDEYEREIVFACGKRVPICDIISIDK